MKQEYKDSQYELAHFNTVSDEEEDSSFLNDLDFIKFMVVARKNMFWVLVIFLVTMTGGFMYNRYTKPIYQSSSIIKLDTKQEANNLGLGLVKNEVMNVSSLSGEVELIKSRLIYEKAAKLLDDKVTCYAYGDINYMERYKNAPFLIEYDLIDQSVYDQHIDIQVIDNTRFELSCASLGWDKKEYLFGSIIDKNNVKLKISLTLGKQISNLEGHYFFVINSLDSRIGYLAGNTEVKIVNPEAKTIQIFFKDFNPAKARDAVAAIDSVYLNESLVKKFKAQEQTIQFLTDQLDQTEESLEIYELKLESFAKSNKTYDVKGDLGKSISKIDEGEKLLIELKEQLDGLEELKKKLFDNTEIKASFPSALKINDPQIAQIITQYNKIQTELSMILTSSTESTFAVQQKKIELDNLRGSALSIILFHKKSIYDKILALTDKIDLYENKFVSLPSKETELTRLKRHYSIYEKFYLLLIEKKAEFGISKAGTVAEFTVLAAPSYPSSPIYPQKGFIYFVSALIGFVISLIFLITKYFLHNTINNQGELEKSTIAPVIGVVPKYLKEKMEVSRMVVDKSPKSPISEALRSIRTNLEFIPTKNDIKKIISVTSTISGEGKTFVAVNLSGVIAMSGVKVLIIDLDMRKPKIHLAFGVDNEKGMSTMLIGKHKLKDCIQHTSIETLDFISAGPTPPNPSELILRTEFDELLKEMHKIYDVIFIDSPPVGLVTDGIIIMKKADLPIYVVRAEYSKKGFEKNINRLVTKNGFRKLSVILNGFDSSMRYGYGYQYGYGYGYGYGGGYYTDDKKEKLTLLERLTALLRK